VRRDGKQASNRITSNTDMKLECYRNLWGMLGPRHELVEKLEVAGYSGVEAVLFNENVAHELKMCLSGRRLALKAVIWTNGRTVEEQLLSFRSGLDRALALEPQSISVIGGYDGWSDDDACRYFEAVLKLEVSTGFAFPHETHRNSILFHPGITLRLLSKFPELKLICDFSHWVLTCERLLDDQLEVVRRSAQRAVHLHARVGTEQSPQLADLRSPEAEPYRNAFERWWEIIWEEQARRGLEVSTFCPELGPPPYQPTLPYTGQPIADLVEQVEWQRQRQTSRFATWWARRSASSSS
jgi:hypothetical protein